MKKNPYGLTRRDLLAEHLDWAWMRVRCFFGKHWPKMGSYPNCARCGKKLTAP